MTSQMEERINREMNGKMASEIQDLVLDNCKATTISGLSDEFTKLTTISMVNIGLTSLDGLPKLPSLRTIDLSDNKLSDGLEKLVESCPRLYHVNLCANKITKLTALEPLKNLQELAALDLFDCSVTESPEYRAKMFAMIPHLKYLDGFDVNDVEADLSEEEDEGAEGFADEEESADDDFDSNDEAALTYLDSSKDEDESEDYVEQEEVKTAATNGEKKNGTESKVQAPKAAENNRKRKLEEATDGAVEKGEGEPNTKI